MREEDALASACSLPGVCGPRDQPRSGVLRARLTVSLFFWVHCHTLRTWLIGKARWWRRQLVLIQLIKANGCYAAPQPRGPHGHTAPAAHRDPGRAAPAPE